MKKRMFAYGWMIVSVSILLALVGCSSNNSFSRPGAFGFEIGGTPPDDAVGTQPPETLDPEEPGAEPTQPPICDPFGDPTTGGDVNAGLVATLTYLDPLSTTSDLVLNDFVPGAPDVMRVANPIFLSRLNKPTSPFDQGFVDGLGTALENADGEVLIEYFALFAASQVRLGISDPEGEYQFALMSDDGSVLHFDEGSGWVKAIDNDGTHQNKIGCSEKISLKEGELLPMELGYFQSPRYRIALMLFWRTGANVDIAEPFCDGDARDDTFFFTPDPVDGSPVATDNYNAFLSRGWKVVGAENFVLPTNVDINPCQ